MTEKKAYPLRINADVLAAAQRWADDELRSLNAQIEYVLRDALRKAGRLPRPKDIQDELTRHGNLGWELVNLVFAPPLNTALLIFKKED